MCVDKPKTMGDWADDPIPSDVGDKSDIDGTAGTIMVDDVPADPNLCDDEGCDHAGTPHVCVRRPDGRSDAPLIAAISDSVTSMVRWQEALARGTLEVRLPDGTWQRVRREAVDAIGGLPPGEYRDAAPRERAPVDTTVLFGCPPVASRARALVNVHLGPITGAPEAECSAMVTLPVSPCSSPAQFSRAIGGAVTVALVRAATAYRERNAKALNLSQVQPKVVIWFE